MISSELPRMFTTAIAVMLAALPCGAAEAVAQGFGGPLTVHGLHQQGNHSAAARGFGGITMGTEGDIGTMFLNAAGVHSLEGIQLSIAGLHQSRDWSQEQQFAPVRYYPNLSLLLEGRTESIPDPDPDLIGFTPADSVQRPFDDIQPSWDRSLSSSSFPLHALLAVPVSLGSITLTAGVGAVQYANLNHFYQNNNVLDPAVLSQRPLPTLRPTDDDPLTAEWYQSIRSREGSIRGYGLSLAARHEGTGLSVGISGLLLRGSSDDFEQRVNRGTLTFLANEFRADSGFGGVTTTGTSEFEGQEFTLSGLLDGRHVSVGFTITPPTKITRSFDLQAVAATSGPSASLPASGEDSIQLPWRGSVGIMLKPREKLRIGLEYELRPYGSATFTSSKQEESSPWESSSLFRVGTQYQLLPWLALRGGIRGEADVFVPDGSAIDDEPATYRVFSVGLGFDGVGFRLNLAYEYADLEYEDLWASAVSQNEDQRHTITANLSYTLPFMR